MAKLSRAKRFSEAISKIEEGKSEIEELMGEIESWKDNMEGANMEHLPKYEEVEQCYDALDEIIRSLEEACDNEPEFPGMY